MSRNPNTQRRFRLLPEHFDGLSEEYNRWKDRRLRQATQLQQSSDAMPAINLPVATLLNPNESAALPDSACSALRRVGEQVMHQGFAVYQFTDTAQRAAKLTLEQSQTAVTALARRLGLWAVDDGVIRESAGLSLLRDLSGTARGRFIPYTNKRMNWHTDGYYNDADNCVRCFTLHCVQPAASGGALRLMDPELLLIALHQDNPAWMPELSHPDAMTLPGNTDNQGHDRPDRNAAVFYAHPDGALGMRFTTRTENIHWRTPDTAAAASRVIELINDNQHWHTRLLLQAGEGMVCRNMLHQREPYTDPEPESGRKILRGRYLQLPRTVVQPANGTDPETSDRGIHHAARQ